MSSAIQEMRFQTSSDIVEPSISGRASQAWPEMAVIEESKMNFLFESEVDRYISRKYRSIFIGFAAFLVTFFIILLSPEEDAMKLNFLTILMTGFNITIGLFLCRAAARIESKMK